MSNYAYREETAKKEYLLKARKDAKEGSSHKKKNVRGRGDGIGPNGKSGSSIKE